MQHLHEIPSWPLTCLNLKGFRGVLHALRHITSVQWFILSVAFAFLNKVEQSYVRFHFTRHSTVILASQPVICRNILHLQKLGPISFIVILSRANSQLCTRTRCSQRPLAIATSYRLIKPYQNISPILSAHSIIYSTSSLPWHSNGAGAMVHARCWIPTEQELKTYTTVWKMLSAHYTWTCYEHLIK